ncbi:hypothetical protein H7Y21_01560 [Arenimonas sp.]|nr:hypothetical protein [Candidatus Parcubacteria bacterium]
MNNKKIIISISVLIVLILAIILFNKTGPQVLQNDEVSTATTSTAGGKMVVDNTIKPATIVNEPSTNYEYQNGVFWGIIKKSAIANGKLILTIDFIQSFATQKETILAAIQDDVCKFPSNQGIKTKQEFINKVMSLNDTELSALISKTNCFPNGIVYYRNASAKLISKDVASNFIAYYPKNGTVETTNTGNMETLNTYVNLVGPSNPKWQITIKDGKVVSLNQPYIK